MKRKRFTEEQFITILKEHAASLRVQDLVRKYSVSEQSICRWKSNALRGFPELVSRFKSACRAPDA